MLQVEEKMLRDIYVDLLIDEAAKNKNLVLVEADLMRAAGTLRFQEQYPERVVDVGVAEANMIGVAAGMSNMGKIPFAHSFTAFATRRCCDQLTLSIAYANLNLKLVGSDPGITAELNGGTHMSMEDVSIIRNIPKAVIFEPTDSAQLKKIFPQIMDHYGLLYMRLFRKAPVKIFDENTPMTLGKGIVLREGKDVTIFASGILVSEAIQAGEELKKMNIDAEIINIHTIKPLDHELVLQSAKKTGAVVTAENHSIIGGLGSAVSEFLSEEYPVPVKRVGIKDCFGEVGPASFLKDKYGLLARDIVDAAQHVIAMK